MKDFISNSSILITGGTGSFGKAFLKHLTNFYPDTKRIVIFSRDELKQWEMKSLYPEEKYPQLRFFIGDIRDKEAEKSSRGNRHCYSCCCSKTSACSRI